MNRDPGRRSVRRIVESVRTLEGAGFPVRRPFPSRELEQIDPFLLLDEMGPLDVAPGEAKGAPEHPHRGFETVTYLLAGSMEHRDSSGHAGHIGPGDVQWMTAGAGVVHSEMPSRQMLERGGRMHGFQLWVNLPRRDKRRAPRYQDVSARQIPVRRADDDSLVVRVIAGESAGLRSPVETHIPILYLHCTLAPGARFEQHVPAEQTAFAYVFGGEGRFGSGGSAAAEGHLVLFADDGDAIVFESTAGEAGPLEVLLLAGLPLREPIARYGPFVMNTKAEILEAIEDYRAGRISQIAAPGAAAPRVAGGGPRARSRRVPRRSPLGGALGVAALGALLAASGPSCAGRSETHTDLDKQQYSTSVSIVGSRSASLLQRGRQAVSEGRFPDAIAAFEEVYGMTDAKPAHREEALLALAEAHANVLNRARDPKKALQYYRQLLVEFPDTKQRYEVEQAIAALEKSSQE